MYPARVFAMTAGNCPYSGIENIVDACCIPEVGCVDGLFRCECWDVGGTPFFFGPTSSVVCSDLEDAGILEDFCDEEPPDPGDQEGCRPSVEFPIEVGTKYHTVDLCETTIMVPTKITDLENSERWAPVSAHESRMQLMPSLQDACGINEGFIALDNRGELIPVACTKRQTGSDYSYWTKGYVFIEKEDGQVISKGSAGIMFGTEAPFFSEVNLFSRTPVCGAPNR